MITESTQPPTPDELEWISQQDSDPAWVARAQAHVSRVAPGVHAHALSAIIMLWHVQGHLTPAQRLRVVEIMTNAI